MGGKSARSGKLLHLCAAVLILVAAGGCPSSQKTVVARGETGGERTERAGKAAETAAAHLMRARALLARGDYEGARREDQRALNRSGKNPPADEALFHLGLVYAHPGNPARDFAKSLAILKRLVQEHPGSPWAEEGRAVLGILEENQRLQALLQQSKKVDLEIEEKKRERGGN